MSQVRKQKFTQYGTNKAEKRVTPPAGLQGEPMKLMIVDDSSIMRKAIEKYLASANVEIVGTAGDGKQAVEMCKATMPDVVTLDITMPEMDGLQCLEELLKIKPDIRVMVVSALKDEATALEALKKGARSFLGKPFTPESIKEAFDQVVAD